MFLVVSQLAYESLAFDNVLTIIQLHLRNQNWPIFLNVLWHEFSIEKMIRLKLNHFG